jgi:hypothetical protein
MFKCLFFVNELETAKLPKVHGIFGLCAAVSFPILRGFGFGL